VPPGFRREESAQETERAGSNHGAALIRRPRDVDIEKRRHPPISIRPAGEGVPFDCASAPFKARRAEGAPSRGFSPGTARKRSRMRCRTPFPR
jgi:hypothetical protein